MNQRLVLRKQRDLGEIISDGLQVYATASLLPMLLVLAIPGALLNLALLAIQLNTSGFVEFFLSVPLGFILGALVGTAAIYALDQYDKGQPASPGQALLRAMNRAGDLIGATIRVFVIVMLFTITIIGIPWAIHRGFRWWFTHQAIMLEGQDAEGSLQYSAVLVAGRGWPTAGRLIVALLVTAIPIFVIQSLLIESASEQVVGLWVAALNFAAFPYTVSTTLMIYYDLRLQKPAITREDDQSAAASSE